jgi:kynurenine 3-monooxygenase
MVPLCGQGLNSSCGLEDVRILYKLCKEESVDASVNVHLEDQTALDQKLARALQCYSDSRHEDLIAICDLSMDN